MIRLPAIIARWFPYPSSGAGVPGLAAAADLSPGPLDRLRTDIAAKLGERRAARRALPPETRRFEHARPMVERLRRDLACEDR